MSQAFLTHWWYNAFILFAAVQIVPYEVARWLLLASAGGLAALWAWRGPLRPPSDGQPLVPADWLYGVFLLVGPVLESVVCSLAGAICLLSSRGLDARRDGARHLAMPISVI